MTSHGAEHLASSALAKLADDAVDNRHPMCDVGKPILSNHKLKLETPMAGTQKRNRRLPMTSRPRSILCVAKTEGISGYVKNTLEPIRT